jgi:glycosyltransferase involved in cell wall biosynthesis
VSRKLKILHLLWSGEIGGTEEYITSLFRCFDSSKYEIFLCFLSEKGIIFEDALKSSRRVSFIGIKNGFDIFGGMKLFKYLYAGKFDIVHSHTPNILSNLTVSLFKKTGKVFTEHVSPGAKELFKKRKLFYYLFSGTFHKVIAISETVRQKLIKYMRIDPDKITVIHDGIRTDKYRSDIAPPQDLKIMEQSKKYTLGFIGRMVDFKRPELYVEIASEILKINRNYYFVMVGDGPKLAKCRNMINEYGISDNFNLLGFRRDIPNILKLFDALLFTSEGEGFGVVLLEAMAMGVPVFAVNDGAVSEIICDKVNGILLNTTEPRLIAKQVIESLDNEDLMNKIKKRCAEDINSKYSVSICARKIENVYEKMLPGKEA